MLGLAYLIAPRTQIT